MKDNKYYCEHLRELQGDNKISTEILGTHYDGDNKCHINIKDIVDSICNDKLIKKYVYEYTWLSGSSTTVYPLTIWLNKDFSIREITIQLSTDKNVFNKLLERYKKKYEDIDYCYFWKSDGSCPSTLNFKMKGRL